MCEDVPKKDGSGKGVGQPGKGCDGKPRKRKGRNGIGKGVGQPGKGCDGKPRKRKGRNQ